MLFMSVMIRRLCPHCDSPACQANSTQQTSGARYVNRMKNRPHQHGAKDECQMEDGRYRERLIQGNRVEPAARPTSHDNMDHRFSGE